MTVFCFIQNADKRTSFWKKNKEILKAADPKTDISELFDENNGRRNPKWYKEYLKKSDFCSGLVHEFNSKCCACATQIN